MVIEVSAAAVVVGAIEVMARSMPAPAESVGASAARARSCSQPEPVDDQEDDLAGVLGHLGDPVGAVGRRCAVPVTIRGTRLAMQPPA